MIEFKNVNKVFVTRNQEVIAMNDISLNIKEFEIFGIAGLSGAGKSTLLRTLNKLELIDSGTILFEGEDIATYDNEQTKILRRNMGMVFQHFNLMGQRNVFNNVSLPLEKSGLCKDEINQKVLAMLERVGLSDKTKNFPHQLSGGEKQRVALARALVTEPKVLLCDEATSALDPQTTQSILQLIQTLNKELGITVVLITHQMEVIKSICDRVAIMERGCIKEVGSTIDVFANPKTAVGKQFANMEGNIKNLHQLIECGEIQIGKDDHLYELTYVGQHTRDAIISETAQQYAVDINILFGNIELINNETVGKLLVSITGANDDVNLAKNDLIQKGVDVYDIVID